MNVICISASNIRGSMKNSTSYRICEIICEYMVKKNVTCKIIDLREHDISPCIGCGGCFDTKRCMKDKAFNQIYEELVKANFLFIVSPHYSPIPAKLSMLLEKMEEITYLHWWKDETYRSEVYGLPTGIISHGGGADWALKSYKAMVNDTIANALATIQCRTVPFDNEWNTGISLPLKGVQLKDGIFPIQEYDWKYLTSEIEAYVEIVAKSSSVM